MNASRSSAKLLFGTAPSPLGRIFFALSGDALCALGFAHQEAPLRLALAKRFGTEALPTATRAVDRDPEGDTSSASSRAAARVRDALARYFEGDLHALDSLPLDGAGTDFQRRVWSALRTIPAGETRSYAELAAQIGSPKAMRAVGLANGRNPISLVVPCHRVIGADGSLTGYAGGLERKRWLLGHERR
jgi:methylated-DNA-[protein]-cysteine S-methyltransferase